MKGSFIVFDGNNGAGKSTQMRFAASYLRDQGYEVVETREPGGTPTAESIREMLLRTQFDSEESLTSTAEILLFLAARAQHVETLIKPAIQRGAIVLCDRFSSSTIAFQCFGLGYPLEKYLQLELLALGGFGPDKVLVFDIEPQEGLKRNATLGEMDDIETRGNAFLSRAQEGFLWQERRWPDRFCIIDASKSKEHVYLTVENLLKQHLKSTFQERLLIV